MCASNILQSFPCRLSDPSCVPAANRIRDLTGDGETLTWLHSHRGWLCQLFTLYTCWKNNMFHNKSSSYTAKEELLTLTNPQRLTSSCQQQQQSYTKHAWCWKWRAVNSTDSLMSSFYSWVTRKLTEFAYNQTCQASMLVWLEPIEESVDCCYICRVKTCLEITSALHMIFEFHHTLNC